MKRSRVARFALLAMAAMALMAAPAGARVGCPNADQAVSSVTAPTMVELARRAVTCLVNQERARYGLRPVYVDARLDLVAQQHNNEMVARNFFGSVDPNGMGPGARVVAEGYGWGSVGENIASGQSTARQAVGAWMLSTANCRNILSPDFEQTGVGLTALPGGGVAEWTEVLARPDFLEPRPTSDPQAVVRTDPAPAGRPGGTTEAGRFPTPAPTDPSASPFGAPRLCRWSLGRSGAG